ncbi:MAG: alpha/beta hydrolase domain-containing protein [Aquabacterium sp.]|jgi:hypothetical protein|uniref:alpha/beta hydrolase domain-containing protein n=1 Tax=Aquabacterium sp. TaxID=1872578 RepID=UPI003BB20FEC
MTTPLSHALRQGALAAALICATWASQAAAPTATVTPGPATPGFGARALFFGDANFVEQEFFLSGQARKFKGSGTLGSDGKWSATVASSNTPYNTVAIVRRPVDPAKFNGIVIVEWLNVSTGYPLDVDWGMAHEAILREGYAYVGVNVQKVGVTGVQKLKQFGDRYANTSIPDDDISYDVFSQTAQALRDQASELLGPLKPTKIIASGHSQSAMRLTTYANAIQPLDKAYDGILIHGRAGTGVRIGEGSTVPSGSVVRADTQVPVFVLQSEMDVSFGPSTSKQPDNAKVRHWEVAGTSHADQYLLDNIGEVSGRDVGWTPPGCGSPYNAMPFYMAQNAAIHHLKTWVTAGTAPPVAPRMARDWLGFIKKDAHGNAVGGVRLPDIEVPIAKYGFANFTTGSLAFLDLFACVAGGNTTTFKADKLKTLYPTHADYVSLYKAAADEAVAKGYIRPADRDSAVKRAQAAAVPQ